MNSKDFKKYGSNTPGNKNGVYDYLFKIWSIWILIILKYKNGAAFLESEDLTDNDFDGLIDDSDISINDPEFTWNDMFNNEEEEENVIDNLKIITKNIDSNEFDNNINKIFLLIKKYP